MPNGTWTWQPVAEDGAFTITYYAMAGTVTVQEGTCPITGCRLVAHDRPETLPRTGSQNATVAGAGALLLIAGAGLVAAAQRRTAPANTP